MSVFSALRAAWLYQCAHRTNFLYSLHPAPAPVLCSNKRASSLEDTVHQRAAGTRRRARVMQQRVDSDEKVQEAIDTCPVSCIHWVRLPFAVAVQTLIWLSAEFCAGDKLLLAVEMFMLTPLAVYVLQGTVMSRGLKCI